MKFIIFVAGALVATTAANVLLASDAYAFTPPNGWTQVGKGCDAAGYTISSQYQYYKLRKDSNQSMYGVYKTTGDSWDKKDITLAEANALMNSKTGTCSGY